MLKVCGNFHSCTTEHGLVNATQKWTTEKEKEIPLHVWNDVGCVSDTFYQTRACCLSIKYILKQNGSKPKPLILLLSSLFEDTPCQISYLYDYLSSCSTLTFAFTSFPQKRPRVEGYQPVMAQGNGQQERIVKNRYQKTSWGLDLAPGLCTARF